MGINSIALKRVTSRGVYRAADVGERSSSAAGPAGETSRLGKPSCRPRLLQRLVRRQSTCLTIDASPPVIYIMGQFAGRISLTKSNVATWRDIKDDRDGEAVVALHVDRPIEVVAGVGIPSLVRARMHDEELSLPRVPDNIR